MDPPKQTGKENIPNLSKDSQCHDNNPARDLVASVVDPGSAGVEEVEADAEGLLSSIAHNALYVAMQVVPPSSGSHVSAIGDLVTPAKSFIAHPSSTIEGAQTTDIIEASRSALTGDAASAGTTGIINMKTSASVLAGNSIMHSGSGAVERLEVCAEGMLPSILSSGLHEAAHVVPLSPDPRTSTNGTLAMPAQSSVTNLSSATGETVHGIEALANDPVALSGNLANVVTTGGTGAIKDGARGFLLVQLRTFILFYVIKLPIVGPYFKREGRAFETLVTETTPLLGSIRDPKAFATKQVEGLLRRMLYPLLNCFPNVDALDKKSVNYGPLFSAFVECYVLAREGTAWLFTNLQEHSLVIAPTVSLGHLSTTDLAASTIGTAVASVTGYSIIQGFVSSLDEVLEEAPDHHSAKLACAQVAVITGIVLFPITNLWAIQSAGLLQRLGQPPEVAVLASKFLQMTVGGLPGYAISEIAKRYLTSQGLSHVHTRILSLITPLNLTLNYVLVGGPIPALRLGFVGAPLSTVLSHNALAMMLMIYIVQRAIRVEVDHLQGRDTVSDEPVHEDMDSDSLTDDDHAEVNFFTGLGTLVLAGISGVLKSATQLWSKDFGGVIASILGPNALATQAVLHTTATTLYQAPKAVGNVSSGRIKKWTAKGNIQRAQIAAFVAFVGTLGTVVLISILLLASAASWGKLFNNDPVIIQSVSVLLPIMALFQAAHGLGAWVDSALGSLGKRAMFPSLNASTDYFIGIPLGVYLALRKQWGLAGLWVGLTISLVCSWLVATIVLVSANWKNVPRKKGRNVSRQREEIRHTTEHGSFGAPV